MPGFGQIWPVFGQTLPGLTTFGRSSTESDSSCADVPPSPPNFGRCRPNLSLKLGHVWSSLARVRPRLSDLTPMRLTENPSTFSAAPSVNATGRLAGPLARGQRAGVVRRFGRVWALKARTLARRRRGAVGAAMGCEHMHDQIPRRCKVGIHLLVAACREWLTTK